MYKNQNQVPTSLSRKGYARYIGYTAWIPSYAVAALLLGVENRTTWIAAGFVSLIAFIVFTVPTFMQARSAKPRERYLREQTVQPVLEPPAPFEQFHDPNRRYVDMNAWLAKAPGEV